jgi:thiol:disulfide interchange protein DsbC
MKILFQILLCVLFLGFADFTYAFQGEGCGGGECKDCHNLSKEEAATLLKGIGGDIVDVKFSEIPSLWVVDVDRQGKVFPIYIDFSKQYLITGRIVKLATKENITQKRFIELNKIDVSLIPLDDAVVLGNPAARHRIIVFDDPECSFCRKLHGEMKKIIQSREDIVFYIKMFPLRIHPQAYDKAKAIVCEKSPRLLEDSLFGKEIPPPQCETDQVDKNIELGQKLSIKSTPTLIFPDGSIVPGYKSAEEMVKLLGADEQQQGKLQP